MCSENAIRAVLSFSFLLHINTPPCVVLGFLLPSSLCSSPADPTESRWIPHPAFCSAFNLPYPWQRALQRNAGVLCRHSSIDLYIIDTHPEGESESRLVSPVSLGEDFFWYSVIDQLTPGNLKTLFSWQSLELWVSLQCGRIINQSLYVEQLALFCTIYNTSIASHLHRHRNKFRALETRCRGLMLQKTNAPLRSTGFCDY